METVDKICRKIDDNNIGSYQKTKIFIVNKEDADAVRKLLKEKEVDFKQFESPYMFERSLMAEDAIRDILVKNDYEDEEEIEVLSVLHRDGLSRDITPCSDYTMALKRASEYMKENEEFFSIDISGFVEEE